MDPKIKRILILVPAGIIMIFLLVGIYKYLSTGVVKVTTQKTGYYARVAKVSEGQAIDEGNSKPINGSASFRLKPGTYQITVYAKAVSISKNLTIKARQHRALALTPPKPVTSEPTYGYPSNDLAASATQTYFIRGLDNRLVGLDSTGGIRPVDTQRAFLSAQWSDASFGVAEDTDKKLYTVDNGVVSPLNLPFSTTDGQDINYAVAPDTSLYVSHGYDVYRYENGSFSKIYSDSYGHLTLAATNGKLAVFYGGTEQTEGAGQSSAQPRIFFMDPQGKVTASIKGTVITSAAWSPDGKHLLGMGKYGLLLFNGSGQQLSSIPALNLDGFAWKDNANFLYGAGTNIWMHDLGGASSYIYSTIPGGTIGGVYISDDKSYVYFGVSGQSGGGSLVRAGLKGQAVPQYLSSLGIFLPESVGACSVNYANFTAPTIMLTYPSLATNAALCTLEAKGELSYYNADPSKFQYEVTPL